MTRDTVQSSPRIGSSNADIFLEERKTLLFLEVITEQLDNRQRYQLVPILLVHCRTTTYIDVCSNNAFINKAEFGILQQVLGAE